ncbi:mannose-6-phosphate isomerase, class I [Micromonospora globispora]|uniref:mannose-6-phosphate isomerase n=1 Tax=Micromonospora globispora TaxID=1450148 RepID=A0A317K551_9ACTN|nr:mannose-6-phosphate isomerase, class I [Micromonospora globispora]PWU48207.1 mannose-6-phosphate isomerase, class I [Micromonospora globispora]PWU61226.1 mannose-6-phosphate isomerase, class I [Micromonospora globispora]RQW90067.1 mannose-6-phosphate isomerase, class I [Micromonospora globispora]
MELLQGRIRDYAWGSRTAIAELQGRPVPSDGPEAELWLGAHPGAPATVDRDGTPVSLTDLLVAEPAHWLGERLVGRFGARLPFLLKVLAADAPLSLQAHPDAEQARVGHAADAGRVNYVDPFHKPELLVALSPFEALCGFRDPAESAAAIAAFGVPALEPVVAALRIGPAGLREAVRLLLSWPEAERAGLVADVLAAEVAGPDAVLARGLAVDYPADPGVVVALLLHHVWLAPGEAIWMPAGNLHAYLRGTGVEIMAASDNVLRGGLTPKRVDVAELLRVLRFEVLDDPVVPPVPVAPGVVTWPVPVEDFALHRVVVEAGTPGARLALPGPRVVLCRAGKLAVDDGVGTVTLGPGQAAVGTAAGGPLVIGGEGEAYVATCGLH